MVSSSTVSSGSPARIGLVPPVDRDVPREVYFLSARVVAIRDRLHSDGLTAPSDFSSWSDPVDFRGMTPQPSSGNLICPHFVEAFKLVISIAFRRLGGPIGGRQRDVIAIVVF